jgi:DNA-binding MarR family transcriptional regulator
MSAKNADTELKAIWARMTPLFSDRHTALLELVRQHGLTPPHGFALASLGFGPLRMREMADLLVCDASYITAVVDRLEETGLASRRPSETDRRVKQIELTPKGIRVAKQITTLMTDPPAELTKLTAHERATLKTILERILPEPEFPPQIFRRPVP